MNFVHTGAMADPVLVTMCIIRMKLQRPCLGDHLQIDIFNVCPFYCWPFARYSNVISHEHGFYLSIYQSINWLDDLMLTAIQFTSKSRHYLPALHLNSNMNLFNEQWFQSRDSFLLHSFLLPPVNLQHHKRPRDASFFFFLTSNGNSQSAKWMNEWIKYKLHRIFIDRVEKLRKLHDEKFKTNYVK